MSWKSDIGVVCKIKINKSEYESRVLGKSKQNESNVLKILN